MLDVSFQIPTVNDIELKLLLKLSKLKRLSSYAQCYQGEINLTTHKKLLHLEKNGYSEVIKGAAIQKWLITKTMSQGEFVFLDESTYLKSNGGDKSKHHTNKRIAMQGITGVNERTRLKSTIIDGGYYCAHSVNYIIMTTNEITYESLLGLLNSKLLNWYFKVFNTNSNVNSYEVSNLPIINDNQILSAQVERIFHLTKSDHYFQSSDNKTQVNKYEEQIDQMVYKLYGLTEEEIKIVESGS